MFFVLNQFQYQLGNLILVISRLVSNIFHPCQLYKHCSIFHRHPTLQHHSLCVLNFALNLFYLLINFVRTLLVLTLILIPTLFLILLNLLVLLVHNQISHLYLQFINSLLITSLIRYRIRSYQNTSLAKYFLKFTFTLDIQIHTPSFSTILKILSHLLAHNIVWLWIVYCNHQRLLCIFYTNILIARSLQV